MSEKISMNLKCASVVRNGMASTQCSKTAHVMAHVMHCVETERLEQEYQRSRTGRRRHYAWSVLKK